MAPSPLRSFAFAGLCLVAAAVATLGAVYQPAPSVTLQSSGGAVTELAPPAPAPAPGG